MSKKNLIPVIDLFAGPGGLGEGFSALTDDNSNRVFRIVLSIEKDEYAHQTLELRSFFRQFETGKVPEEYYKHLRGEISREQLFDFYPDQKTKAKDEAWKAELGLTPVDEIDNRIAKALNKEESWILIGGPPCQAYSLVGRSRNQLKKGLNENDPRVYLYREYYRILAVHNPPFFIMENVKGLLSSKVKGDLIFRQVLEDLRDPVNAYYTLHAKNGKDYACPGYNIYSLVKEPANNNLFPDGPEFQSSDYVIKCEEYGIPQTRHRVILLGIRKDINVVPGIMDKLDHVSIENAIGDLPRVRSGISKSHDDKKIWKHTLRNLFSAKKLNDIEKGLREELQTRLQKLTVPQKNRGGEFVSGKPSLKYQTDWFVDTNLKGFCNYSTRSHIADDLYRYLFAACFAAKKKFSPKLNDFPAELLPDHHNVSEALEENKFADRFRVQLKNEPAKTITSHIAKDGHYYIHYDPLQCRSLTVREAARIQTFPDNYFFCGPRTLQYQQVGNAVPPLLAKQIGELLYKIISQLSI
jgi:DNA (cytosine-5)-methyltransferase 1